MESPNSMYNNLNGTNSASKQQQQQQQQHQQTVNHQSEMTLMNTTGESTTSAADNLVIPSNFLISTKEIIARFPHNKRVGHYLLGRKLGEGSFAKVKEGLHTITGQKVAIKVIDKKKAKEDAYVSKNMRREGKLLQMIIHPNIIQLYELMETENSYYLVTELCEGGDLMDYICARKYLSEAVTRKFIRQIISAVDYLHRIGILHRDLKIENLLLDKNLNIKLIDFGLSNYTKSELCITQCGSPAYAAPELLAHKKYGSKVDVWSIGVNMYAMLTGNLPFTVEPFNIKSLYNKMMKNEMNAIPEHLSKSGEDLLRKLLNPDPVKRISLKEAMEHPWLNEGYSSVLKPFPYPNKPTEEQVNATIMRYMNTNMEFSLSEILENIKVNKPSSSLATYYLLLHKVKSMLLKIDPKKEKITKPQPTKQIVKTEVKQLNNTNKPASVVITANPNQQLPTLNNPNSPVSRIVNKTSANSGTAQPNTSNQYQSTTRQIANNNKADVTVNKYATKQAELTTRTLSPTVQTPTTPSSTTTTNTTATSNTSASNSSSTTTPILSSNTPTTTTAATNPTTFTGAMKNLTQKYKTMHLTAGGTTGLSMSTDLSNSSSNNNNNLHTVNTSTPPPPPTLINHHNSNSTNNNTRQNATSPTSNLYFSNNNQKSHNNTLLNSIDVTLNSTIQPDYLHKYSGLNNNSELHNNHNLPQKSSASSSSSSEETTTTTHHIVNNRPIIKTTNLAHRNSLNNGTSALILNNSNGSSSNPHHHTHHNHHNHHQSNLNYSNSTKLNHSEWTTQMIKLNSGNNSARQQQQQQQLKGADFNNNDLMMLNNQRLGSPLSNNGDQTNTTNNNNNTISSSSSSSSHHNNNNGSNINMRKSPVVKKLNASSPITLPTIDNSLSFSTNTNRANTPQQ